MNASITTAALDRILAFLAPLFLPATPNDLATARLAAEQTLASYGCTNEIELRLVAKTIAFDFGALDALGAAMAPDLPVTHVLRLRTNATALSRAGHASQRLLDKLRRENAKPPAPKAAPAIAQDAPDPIEPPDLLTFARAAAQAMRQHIPAQQPLTQTSQTGTTQMSRPQRRHLERQAEKARRRDAELARRTERAAALRAA
jgi:hypothetical protein